MSTLRQVFYTAGLAVSGIQRKEDLQHPSRIVSFVIWRDGSVTRLRTWFHGEGDPSPPHEKHFNDPQLLRVLGQT